MVPRRQSLSWAALRRVEEGPCGVNQVGVRTRIPLRLYRIVRRRWAYLYLQGGVILTVILT